MTAHTVSCHQGNARLGAAPHKDQWAQAVCSCGWKGPKHYTPDPMPSGCRKSGADVYFLLLRPQAELDATEHMKWRS